MIYRQESIRYTACGAHSGQTGRARAVPPKTFAYQSLKFSKNFAFKPKVKTVAEKLSFKLRIWPGHLVMDILKSSQLVIFSHSTIFITFTYRSLASFLFKLLRSSRGRKPEVALDFCVWPLCGLRHRGMRFEPLWRVCGIPYCTWLSFVEKCRVNFKSASPD